MKDKTKSKIVALSLLGSFLLSGCAKELAAVEEYDQVEQNIGTTDLQNMGLTQELEVPGEKFKLVTEYACDSASKRAWRITSDKFLFLKVYTNDLSNDTLVYIDNIHIDTSIKSKYAAMDGILQDTMDDRIHNSLMYGFPVSNSEYYYGVFAVEGCNETFIQGSYHGMNGYSSGSVTEKRYTEADYMKYEVWANKFQIVYDLLIKGPNDKDFRNVSVKTDFVVPVTTRTIEYDNGTVYYYEDGIKKELKKEK